MPKKKTQAYGWFSQTKNSVEQGQEQNNSHQTQEGYINRGYLAMRIWKYLYRYKWLLLCAFLLTMVSNLLVLVGPMLSGYAIDAIAPGQGAVLFDKVFFYAGLMILFYAISSMLSYGLSLMMIRLSQRVSYNMRQDITEKLMELPVSYFDRTQTGDIVSRISYDVDTLNASLSTDLLQISTSFITVFGSFIMMLTISPPLVTIFLFTIPASVLFTRYRTRVTRPMFKRRSAKLGELNGFVEEVVSGQKTIKAYHQEETMIGRFDQRNEEAVEAYYRADYYGSMNGPFVNFINNISLSLISVMGTLLFLFGHLSLGNLSSFVLYSRKFSGPINEMANIISELQSAMAAAERIFRLLDEAPEPADAPGATELSNVQGNVSIQHLDFSYVPGTPIIQDFNLEVEKGNLIAIVGPTGAGKTTLINLLMRFYDPQAGRILVDGYDIGKVTRKSLRAAYTMVLQDTWLFSGTVFQNIAYGKKDATMEEVVAAAKAAKIHSYIMQLPNGYDTILTEDGVNISKGQKQMLTIARAMLMDSKMLILDEATSNVDTQTEQQIQQAMQNLMKGKTCFVIAHRLSTIQNADQILVVNKGSVVEQGTHNQLLQKNGFYAQLYNSQFQ